MLYFALGFSLNCIIWEPLSCLSQLFFWPKANKVILQETDHPEQVPETVEQMAKLIEAIRAKNESKKPNE